MDRFDRERRNGGLRWWGAAAVVAVLAVPGDAAAQDDALTAACAAAAFSEDARRFCNLVAQTFEVAQPRIGLAATGGNPVPGTASTLGRRLGTLPRISAAGRATGVWVDLPQILEREVGEDIDFVLPSLNVDAAVGVYPGFSPAPTVGGVGSVDLLGSLGLLPLPSGDGFENDLPFTWALGARLGLLRESFTLPGASLSAMYRRVGDVTFGDIDLDSFDAFFESDLGIWSFRAAVSKQFLVFGATAGVGYDRFASDLGLGIRSGGSRFTFGVDDVTNRRVSAFANLSATLLILHLVAELGWQAGADLASVPLPADVDFDADDGAFFGSVAIRVSI